MNGLFFAARNDPALAADLSFRAYLGAAMFNLLVPILIFPVKIIPSAVTWIGWLLIGFGTRMSGGCTVDMVFAACQFIDSPLIATLTFMATA